MDKITKQQKISFFILLGAILIVVPVAVFAVNFTPPLITCAVHTGADSPENPKIPGMLSPMTPICNICDLFLLLQKGFNFIWYYISVPLAVVMILYGGFLMVLPSFGGQSSSQLERGKKILRNAFLGLVIVFFAWIGVDAILKVLGAKQSTPFGPWNQIRCDEAAARIPTFGGPVDVIPPEDQCPAGTPHKYVDGSDVCDPIQQQAIVTRGSIIGQGDGQCNASSISQLNSNYGSVLDTAAQQEGVDPKMLRAIALIESTGNPNSVSRKGAAGLVQVMPSTARGLFPSELGNMSDSEITSWLKTPQNGARAGARYVKTLLNSPKVGGRQDYMLVRYNAAVSSLDPSVDCPGQVKGLCPINPGGFAETQKYIPKVQNCLALIG